MTFLFFLVMQNKLKPATTETIAKLNNCAVRTVMATGDNVLTAISVARQCGLVSNHKEIMLADIVELNGQ